MRKEHILKTTVVPALANGIAAFVCFLPIAALSCAPAPVGILEPVYSMEGSGDRSGTWSFDLGPEPRDVYFVFNNVSIKAIEGGPRILGSSFPAPEEAPSLPRSIEPSASPFRGKAIHVPAGSIPLPDQLPEAAPGARAYALPRGGTAALNGDVVGATETFLVYDWGTRTNDSMGSTCRWTSGNEPVDLGGGISRKLSIWVADGQWDATGTDYPKVSQEMVEAVGRWFLGYGTAAERATNSIFRLVTDMIGLEWGPDAPAGYIPFDRCVTILLADINLDDSPNGGTVGYFANGNNFLGSRSNERIMFVIDAPMLANSNDHGYDNRDLPPAQVSLSDKDWSAGDYWPEMVYSTLAHEFQHMINFYQKHVLRNVSERTWTDEMCAMSVEDLISTYMGVPGPRGVPSADLSAGSPGNQDGRIPGFNEFTEIGLSSSWSDESLDPSVPYSLTYAFGAYLIRNYGGPAFLRRIVQAGKGGEAAVVDAVRAYTEGQEIFATLLKRFSAAVLLSPWTEAPPYYRFNNGSAGFSFSMDGGQTRSLGSINFFNYVGSSFRPDGPTIRASDLQQTDDPPGYSHIFYRAGKGLRGRQSFSLSLPAGLSFSIVSLPSP